MPSLAGLKLGGLIRLVSTIEAVGMPGSRAPPDAANRSWQRDADKCRWSRQEALAEKWRRVRFSPQSNLIVFGA